MRCNYRAWATGSCRHWPRQGDSRRIWTKEDVIEWLLSIPANSVAVADGGFQDKKKVAKGGVEEVEEEVKKEKIVKATKKGAAVLDEHIPDDIKMTYHVLQVGDEIYDATLNHTNVGDNNNNAPFGCWL